LPVKIDLAAAGTQKGEPPPRTPFINSSRLYSDWIWISQPTDKIRQHVHVSAERCEQITRHGGLFHNLFYSAVNQLQRGCWGVKGKQLLGAASTSGFISRSFLFL